ncbi:hypothetical protein Angca_007572, partial [Angiostrongylus cantonensis]
MWSRVNNWYDHFLSRRVVPLQRDVLPKNAVTEGYAVVVRQLRLPKLSHTATYQMSCYFFDAKTAQFFGGPYQSVERRPGRNECGLDDDLFFHCPHLDDAVHLVIEVIEKNTNVNAIQQPVTLAWGLLKINGYLETVPEYSRVPAGFDLQKIKLYPGSPKVLTFNAQSHLQLTASGSLECSLYSHRRLLDAVDYFPDFCIVGSRYDIPGLLVNDSGPQLAMPTPMPHVPSSLDGIALSYGPHAERIEKLILDDVRSSLSLIIKIGVHNGFTFLFEPIVVHLSSIDEQFLGTHSLRRKGRPLSRSSGDIRTEMNSLFVRPRVSLPKMANDDRLVIVFALDYMLGIRSSD